MKKSKFFRSKDEDDYKPPRDLLEEDAEVPLDVDGWPEAKQLPKFLRQLYDYPTA